MSDYPHGHHGHSGWNCEQCVFEEKERVVNEFMKDARVIEGEHSLIMTNMQPSWVAQKDGSLVSIEYAKTLNRAERRRKGIVLY